MGLGQVTLGWIIRAVLKRSNFCSNSKGSLAEHCHSFEAGYSWWDMA